MVLKDVVFMVHFGLRNMSEQNRDWRYQREVAAMVAGELPAKIMEEWRAQGRTGVPS